MNEKIQPTHLERDAYVYVRQSSMTQVRHRLKSQDRQYGLADRARGLGFTSVQVIDRGSREIRNRLDGPAGIRQTTRCRLLWIGRCRAGTGCFSPCEEQPRLASFD